MGKSNLYWHTVNCQKIVSFVVSKLWCCKINFDNLLFSSNLSEKYFLKWLFPLNYWSFEFMHVTTSGNKKLANFALFITITQCYQSLNLLHFVNFTDQQIFIALSVLIICQRKECRSSYFDLTLEKNLFWWIISETRVNLYV